MRYIWRRSNSNRWYSKQFESIVQMDMQINSRPIIAWGTGAICRCLMEQECMRPVFFLDNNIGKHGTVFMGFPVLHPNSISSWGDYYIVVATDHYYFVKKQLEDIGLEENEDFIWYRKHLFPSKMEELTHEAKCFIGLIEKDAEKYKQKSLVFSDYLSFDKGVCEYISNLQKENGDLLLCSEISWILPEKTKYMLNYPVVVLPSILSHNQYLDISKGKQSYQKAKKYVNDRDYLIDIALNYRLGYPDMAEGYEFILCMYANQIIQSMLKMWEPREVYLWNAFYGLHALINKLCRQLDIEVYYLEFGPIPGTIILDKEGQMGESVPAKQIESFQRIMVSQKEYEETDLLIKQLRDSKKNRNVQYNNGGSLKVKQGINMSGPIILYCGQNDNASGMQPYTENTRLFHSPIFQSSDEAAVFLAGIAKDNSWNFIYKPHPMMLMTTNRNLMPSNVILVDDGDINDLIDASDVVITILSTVSYIALIRRKPVVMMGYTQLKGKGCTYEAFGIKDIKKQIEGALENGITEVMKENFVKHISRLQSFY